MTSSSRRRCVVFFYEGYLGVSPATINLSKALAHAGYDVTIYSTPTSAAEAGDMGDVKVSLLEPSRFGRWLGRVGVGRYRVGAAAGRLAPIVPVALFALRSLWRELAAALREDVPTIYVAIDMDASLATLLCATALDRPYIYLSLELTFAPSQRRGPRAALIRLAYRRSAAALTQGLDRLTTMIREFQWTHPRVFILPNAPFAGPPAEASAGSLLRTLLKVPPSRRIALQAGMIEDRTCCTALARAFVGADDWALVLHERSRHSPDEPYMVALRRANAENLYLSLEPVPYDQIDEVFASADIGLAFYEPSGPDDDDFRFISSSGKLPHYLKHGKPILVSDLPPLVEIVRAFDCGVVISDPSSAAEVGAALREIDARYDELSRNARRCFEERYDFGKAVEPVVRFVDGLVGAQAADAPPPLTKTIPQ